MDGHGKDTGTAGGAGITCSDSCRTVSGGETAPSCRAAPGAGADGSDMTVHLRPRRRSLAGRCGIPREDERVYVAVQLADVAVAPGRRAGRPATVCWPDGRTWCIRGVFATRQFGRAEFGNLCQRWDVEIQGRRVELWWEHGAWFVAKGSGLAV